jgi:nitroimidazol reductase NimA-like FMN-containing flavoprotein (pyridoxamine 5'-phosphate oxidase superfamily)
MTMRPEFLVLTPDDCHKVLEWNSVGRLAFLNATFVDIEPIGYVASGDWIFFRSAYGAKLEALVRHPFVAFEVDQVAGPTSWVSVVAHGTIYMLPADGGPVERREFARALDALRRLSPAAFTGDDPTPERQTVYGMHIDRVAGRMAQPSGTDRKGRVVQPSQRAPERGVTNGS